MVSKAVHGVGAVLLLLGSNTFMNVSMGRVRPARVSSCVLCSC